MGVGGSGVFEGSGVLVNVLDGVGIGVLVRVLVGIGVGVRLGALVGTGVVEGIGVEVGLGPLPSNDESLVGVAFVVRTTNDVSKTSQSPRPSS